MSGEHRTDDHGRHLFGGLVGGGVVWDGRWGGGVVGWWDGAVAEWWGGGTDFGLTFESLL